MALEIFKITENESFYIEGSISRKPKIPPN